MFKLLALSLLAKVIMSLYFAYSWTFDEVYFDAFGNYQKIDKSPPKVFWNMQRERWHTELQWTAVSYYIDYATVAIAYCFVICFYQWFGELYLHICGGGTVLLPAVLTQSKARLTNVHEIRPEARRMQQ